VATSLVDAVSTKTMAMMMASVMALTSTITMDTSSAPQMKSTLIPASVDLDWMYNLDLIRYRTMMTTTMDHGYG
jgi:hypothetical protein